MVRDTSRQSRYDSKRSFRTLDNKGMAYLEERDRDKESLRVSAWVFKWEISGETSVIPVKGSVRAEGVTGVFEVKSVKYCKPESG